MERVAAAVARRDRLVRLGAFAEWAIDMHGGLLRTQRAYFSRTSSAYIAMPKSRNPQIAYIGAS
jgi:hypothetical protein